MTAVVGLVQSGADDIALGALFATVGTGLKPRRRVISALRAAERFSASVRGPFVCLRSRRRKGK